MKYWQPFGIDDPDAGYINGDPSIGRAGSIPPAEAFEQDMREIVNMITGNGLTPSAADVTQLLLAARSQRMNYAVATNTSPNAIAVSFYPPISNQMTPGMPLRIKPPLSNTGPSTLVVDTIAYPLRRADGSELQNNDILATIPFECMWNDAGYWIVTSFRGLGGILGGDTINNTYVVKIPYTTDHGTPNHIIANFTPPITAPIPGDAIEVRLANNITGACGITINGLPEVAVTRPNGTPMIGGDGVVDQIALMLRANDGTWQFTGVVPLAASGFFLPVGSLVISMSNLAIPGTLKLNGALLNRSEHQQLWTLANASNRIVDESIWLATAQRTWTSFSRGDGINTFRLPDFRAEFPRWWDDGRGQDTGRVLGTQQADDIKLHTHKMHTEGGTGVSPGGSVSGSAGNKSIPGPGGGFYVDTFPVGGPESRGRNCALVPCIVDG